MELEVGDIVMCTVDRIVGTVVFVRIHLRNKELEGSIITSEIAPGRIRNLRDYVFPNKKIVCKVLRITGDRIDLSLRRVGLKEQKEIKEREKQERNYKSILKSIIGEKADEVTKEILKKEELYDFFRRAKENSENLENIVGKNDSEKILDIIKSQKQKKIIIKKEISLITIRPNGLELIKNILTAKKIRDEEINVSYLAAGRYIIKTESSDPKTADNKLKEIISEIEKQAKEQELNFSVKEK